MDRRQRKTREGIFKAFIGLLAKKNFNQITVGEIIERADVGRATFYAHFDSIEDAFYCICENYIKKIFMVFLNERIEYKIRIKQALNIIKEIILFIVNSDTISLIIFKSLTKELITIPIALSVVKITSTTNKYESSLARRLVLNPSFFIKNPREKSNNGTAIVLIALIKAPQKEGNPQEEIASKETELAAEQQYLIKIQLHIFLFS